MRVEGALHLAERLRDAGAEHALGEDAAQDAVPVLAAQAAAELEHEIGDVFGDALHRREPRGVLHVHLRPDVQAADAGVAVVGGRRAVSRDRGVETRDELGEPLRRDGRVLHQRHRLRIAAHAHQDPEPGLSHAPHPRLLAAVGRAHHRVAEAALRQVARERLDPLLDRVERVVVELDQQQRARRALHELDERGVADALAAALDDRVVDEFDGRGVVFQRRDRRLRGLDERLEVDGRQPREGRQRLQPHPRLRDGGERALGAHDHARDIHQPAVAGECVQVVAGDAPRDVREARRDLVAVLGAQAAQPAVDIALEVGLLQLRREFRAVHAREPCVRAVGEHDLQFDHLIERLAVEHGVRAAGVVADPPADRRLVRRRGVDGVVQAVRLQFAVQLRQHHARLHARPPLIDVDLDHLAHVGREVEHDGMVHALAGETRPAAARQHRHAPLPRDPHHVLHVLHAAREDDGERLHLVDRGVGRVQQPRGAVDAHARGARVEPGGERFGERLERRLAAVEQVERVAYGGLCRGRLRLQHGPDRRHGEVAGGHGRRLARGRCRSRTTRS